MALAVSQNLGFTSEFLSHLAVAGTSAQTVGEALVIPKLFCVLTGICSGWWCCGVTCPRRGPWAHSVLQQGRPMPLGGSHLLPTDFWAVSLLRWQKPHCKDAAQRSSHTALLPNPSFPSALPRGPSTAVGAQPQAHPPVCAIIITWSQKDEVGHWGHPLAATVLALLLSFCSPALCVAPEVAAVPTLPAPWKSGSWNYFLLPLYLLCILP